MNKVSTAVPLHFDPTAHTTCLMRRRKTPARGNQAPAPFHARRAQVIVLIPLTDKAEIFDPPYGGDIIL